MPQKVVPCSEIWGCWGIHTCFPVCFSLTVAAVSGRSLPLGWQILHKQMPLVRMEWPICSILIQVSQLTSHVVAIKINISIYACWLSMSLSVFLPFLCFWLNCNFPVKKLWQNMCSGQFLSFPVLQAVLDFVFMRNKCNVDDNSQWGTKGKWCSSPKLYPAEMPSVLCCFCFYGCFWMNADC